MRTYNPGEVIKIAFPYDEGVGFKVRPVLIWKDLGDAFLAIKITSQQKGRDWELPLPRDQANGLTKDSVIRVNKIRKFRKSDFPNIIPIGTIGADKLSEVGRMLRKFKEHK